VHLLVYAIATGFQRVFGILNSGFIVCEVYLHMQRSNYCTSHCSWHLFIAVSNSQTENFHFVLWLLNFVSELVSSNQGQVTSDTIVIGAWGKKSINCQGSSLIGGGGVRAAKSTTQDKAGSMKVCKDVQL
jgi:hypothetical protein